MLEGPEPDTDHRVPKPGDWGLRFLTGKYAESERALKAGEALELAEILSWAWSSPRRWCRACTPA